MPANSSRKLRSQEWWSGSAYENYARRAWLRSEGFNSNVFDNKPVIGICNSWSELNNCNVHLRTVAEAVKRGVWAAGGVPLEFPTISLGEMFMKPTTMLYRNLMAMDVEESIRANPIDGVVLLCGCDKTTPAQLMGAASADIPAIVVPGGPMLSGNWRDRRLGSGTDGRKLFDLFRTGQLGEEEWSEIEGGLSRSAGHCTVMGTASTMTSIAEALGMTLTGCANIPAPDSRRLAIAELSGRRAVELVWEDVRPSQIMTRQALENAITVDMAIGGSTNAVVHLVAIAGRLGIPLELNDFDAISRRTPWIVNVKPSGEFLMEDFYYAGALPAVMKEIADLLHGDALTVTGKTMRENLENAQCHRREVIRTVAEPLHKEGGTAILYGNLAPDGAVLKQTAASPRLLQHRGRAYVFENYQQMRAEIDREDLPVDENTVLVMKNLRTKRCAWIPRVGPHPHATRALESRHRRHGAHQRRAHERHQLRNRGAARGAGIGRGRAAGRRRNRRRNRARRGRAPHRAAHTRGRDQAPSISIPTARPAIRPRLRPPVPGTCHASKSRLRFRFPAEVGDTQST